MSDLVWNTQELSHQEDEESVRAKGEGSNYVGLAEETDCKVNSTGGENHSHTGIQSSEVLSILSVLGLTPGHCQCQLPDTDRNFQGWSDRKELRSWGWR
jgi:hypothetical protein